MKITVLMGNNTAEIFKSFDVPALNRFLKKKEVGISLSLTGLNNPLRLLILNNVAEKLGKKVLFITLNEQSALKYQKDLESLFDLESKILPFQEINPYEDVDRNYYIYEEQVNVLNGAINGDYPFVIAPLRALTEKFPDKNFYAKNSFKIKKNEELDYAKTIEKLIDLGYKRVPMAMDSGEFSIKGDILDIFTLYSSPVRVEFFADTIEDIRMFDPTTQKSFQKLDEITVYPLHKFLINDEIKKSFKAKLYKEIEKFGENETIDILYGEICEKIDNEGYFEGIEYYQNYLNKDLVSPLDFFRDFILVFDDTAQINAKFENIDDDFIKSYQTNLASGLKLPLSDKNHVTYSEYKKEIQKFKHIGFDTFLENFGGDNLGMESISDSTFAQMLVEFDSELPPFFSSSGIEISDFIDKKTKDGAKVFVCTNYPKRFSEILKEFEIYSENIFILPPLTSGGGILHDVQTTENQAEAEQWPEKKSEKRPETWIFLSDKELFNKRSKDITSRKYTSNKQSQDYIDSINDIMENEFVVHTIHGIGIFKGLRKEEMDGALKDYLEIQFQGGDKLFMPAEQINLLYRYRGGGGTKPKLSKMGGAAWENTKNKAKGEVKEIAYDLLKLYAKREMSTGIAFEPDTTWQYEMEDAFEFTETPDQMRSIEEVKADMESERPMDRLICADVGFGKTEVAIRAIFKAVMSGKQAALIAPTTILALQHYQTIAERFKPFSVNVQLLSRFKTPKERRETIKMLTEGTCDVVVGTHSLLFDREFKNLGLLVIDEEHKFGVAHKEKLKKFRENIDILAMSATPIPRTLNMALSGLKNMSLINTPPKNRLPVKTYVGEFNEAFLKNAVNHELQRDGQVFFVHNRVESIHTVAQYLQSLLPNARIAVAHGQMNENELEKIMYDFAMKEYDILLCTTIIESGLDISNANTIIINDSDRFGLAQLYQLRGRVGRSDRQAFCYCFYKKSKELSADAFKRLSAIKDFASLGSGYQIALRDIEIRGVGNILGAKQHGHMVNVGFDTYVSLLEECVNELKNEAKSSAAALQDPYKKQQSETKQEPCIVDIKATAYIPDEWVGSYEQKMLEYKRLSDVKSISELESMAASFRDRFSKLPESVENLIKLIRLRLLGTAINITQIRETPDNIRIYTPYTMQEWLILKRKLDLNITKYFQWTNPPKSVKGAKGILLMKKSGLEFNEIFNILADLFYYISHIILEFKK